MATAMSDDEVYILLQEAFQSYASAEQVIEGNQLDMYANGRKPQDYITSMEMNGTSSHTAVTGGTNGKKGQINEESDTINHTKGFHG